MKPTAYRFTLTEGEIFSFGKNGHPALSATLAGGELAVPVYYDSHEEPLVLRAEAKPGQTALLVLRPCRIELHLDGELLDEEWPWGEPLLEDAVLISGTAPEKVPVPEEKILPSFCGSVEQAEGWCPGKGVFVGDCMPYCDGERYHVLWLKDRHRHHSKWGKGAHQWAHMSTADFRSWDLHPMAVEIDEPWQGSICTGSWIDCGETQQLYYTVRTNDGSPAPLCRSISRDGYHFEKDRDFRFTLSSAYNGASARDPKAVRDAEGGLHLFVTSTELATRRGCLVHLFSEDGDNWRELGVIYRSPDEREPECPDYFVFGGRYYLVFSLGGFGHYLWSDRPFDGWREPADPVIPTHRVPKAAVWKGRLIFTAFESENMLYAGTMTFLEAFAGENGELVFGNGPLNPD